MTQEPREALQQAVISLFSIDQGTVSVNDNSVVLGLSGLKVVFHVPPPPPSEQHSNVLSLPIEAFFQPGSDQSMYDICAGVGITLEERFFAACRSWRETTYQVIRRFLDEGQADSSIGSADTSTGAIRSWSIYESDARILAVDDSTKIQLVNAMREPPILSFFVNGFANVQAHSSLEHRIYWLKVSHFRNPDGSITSDIWLNNQNWDEGHHAIQQFKWPTPIGFMGFSQFFILKPSAKADETLMNELGKQVRQVKKKWWWPF